MKARFLSLFIVLLAALGLAGCFTSTAPLFGDEKAVAPYARITYATHGSSDDDKVVLTREGKAYIAKTEKGSATMRFMPVGDDLYLAEFSQEQKGGTLRLYGVVKLDPAKHLAAVYKSMAHADDIGPGLPACEEGKTNSICIADVDAYVALAKAAIAAGDEPDTTYDVTFD